MAEILAALATTPLPTILTIAGIFFLLLAVAPITIKGVMVGKPSSKRQLLSGIIGVLLLLGGVSLFWAATIKSTSPTATEMPLPPTIEANSITNTPPSQFETLTPTIEIISPTLTSQPTTGKNIAITEVMAVPCGNKTGPSANEYIEIYNYGTVSADVNGWWIATNNLGNGSSPDKIVSWETRNSGLYIGSQVVINTTIIPPSGYAVILPPKYFAGDANIRMPYIFPEGTIILTIDNGEYLGDENFGLTGTSSPLSVIVLYIGTSNIIDKVISTYGSPKYGASPESISDNGLDKIPYSVELCYSVERISASGPDSESNWRKLKDGSPGFGDYR
jgi:hypothetical protein